MTSGINLRNQIQVRVLVEEGELGRLWLCFLGARSDWGKSAIKVFVQLKLAWHRETKPSGRLSRPDVVGCNACRHVGVACLRAQQ